jgi:hypothetical protein
MILPIPTKTSPITRTNCFAARKVQRVPARRKTKREEKENGEAGAEKVDSLIMEVL